MIRAVLDARFDLPQSEPRLRPHFETGARNLSQRHAATVRLPDYIRDDVEVVIWIALSELKLN